jgi:transposase
MSKSKVKTILICFFDIRSIIHFESVPEGTTVNQTFYMQMLRRFIVAVRSKRGELWRDRSLIRRHDNAPAHPSLRVTQFLAGKGISGTDHPPYSPDLAPADFWLFPELKSVLKAKRFSDLEDIKSSVGKKFYRHSSRFSQPDTSIHFVSRIIDFKSPTGLLIESQEGSYRVVFGCACYLLRSAFLLVLLFDPED